MNWDELNYMLSKRTEKVVNAKGIDNTYEAIARLEEVIEAVKERLKKDRGF